MLNAIRTILLSVLLFSGVPSTAQTAPYVPGPFPTAKQVGIDPFVGPLCDGPLGVGACAVVQRDINFRNALTQVPMLNIVANTPAGPVCAGPLGNAPCEQVRQFLAAKTVAKSEIVLPQTTIDPTLGALCVGPFGEGPCDAVREYIALTVLGVPPIVAVNPQNPVLISNGNPSVGPMCHGPFGSLPCSLLAQASIDSPSVVPPWYSFGIPPGLKDSALAAACAQKVRLDVSAFAACTGKTLVLSARNQEMLNCAARTANAQAFGVCAAPLAGIGLSDEQRVLAGCAAQPGATATSLTLCAGNAFGDRLLTKEQQQLVKCAQNSGTDSQLVNCAGHLLLRPAQAQTLECAVNSADSAAFAACASGNLNVRLSDDQRRLVRCASSSKGDSATFSTCLGNAALAGQLGARETALLNCALTPDSNAVGFAACAAPALFGSNLSREQTVALRCAAQSNGNAAGFATCAAVNFFNLRLNPEQQIIVQCVASTGGQPYAAAGCMGSRLTARELTKCLTDGFGGKGCFGDTNDLVGKNGWASRTFGDLAKIPGALPMVPSLIWAGDLDFLRNPGSVFSGSNAFINKPSQIFGGPNSLLNKAGSQVYSAIQNPKKAVKKLCGNWCP